MKKLKNICICVLAVLLALCLFTACDGSGDGYSGYAPSDSADYEKGDAESEQGQSATRKQLTAAEWCDAAYYEFWRSLFAQGGEQGKRGIFANYAEHDRGLSTEYMHEIRVEADGKAVAGAQVRLYNGSKLVYTAVTDASGKAYTFGKNADFVEAESGLYSARVPLDTLGVTTVKLSDAQEKQDAIEIAFVIDTTASMGDELGYLKKELDGVLRRVCRTVDMRMRLGLVFYRDDGDAYVTRTFDFTDVSTETGLQTVRENLNAQVASGGGDYPERADRALAEAVQLNWSNTSATKLLFHVLDAPYHDKSEHQKIFADAVYAAAGNGIRIIPIAASGLDTFGQYVMRSAALLTGGTYTFLTDDSGIGESHEEPEVGGYTVEYLSDMLVRLVVGYHTGKMPAPVHWTQSSDVL